MGVIGKPTLRQALDSIKKQEMIPGDCVIVCVDSFEQGPRPDVQTLVEGYGFDFCFLDAGYHFFGVEQCNYATSLIDPMRCSHVMSMGDDDVLVDGTFAALRAVAGEHPDRVIISRQVLNGYGLIWEIPAMRRCHVTGQCMLSPLRDLGVQDTRHDCTVDFDWMMDAIRRSGQPALFLDFVSTIAHTDGNRTGIWRCGRCGAYGYNEDSPPLLTCCGQFVDRNPKPRVVEQVAVPA